LAPEARALRKPSGTKLRHVLGQGHGVLVGERKQIPRLHLLGVCKPGHKLGKEEPLPSRTLDKRESDLSLPYGLLIDAKTLW